MRQAAAAQPAVEPIAIGMLGGAHSHALDKWKRLSELAEFQWVGLVAENDAVRQKFSGLSVPYCTQDELFARATVVVVESDNAFHAEHARTALQQGKHVHVEKPPTDNLAEMEQLLALAAKKNLVLQPGYMWRHHLGMAKIFEAVRQGWLGDILLVRGAISNRLAVDQRPAWSEFRGGGMFELGAHLIDAVVRLLGEPDTVVTSLQTAYPTQDGLADNNVAIFTYPTSQAIVVNLLNQPNAFRHRGFEVIGSRGTATLGPIEPPRLTFDMGEAAGPYQAGLQEVDLPPYARYIDDFRALGRAVRGDEPLEVDHATELAVHRTLLAASEML